MILRLALVVLGRSRGLGCRRAVALDGGVSAQLMARDNGDRIVWRGWRKVPLGLIAVPVHEE